LRCLAGDCGKRKEARGSTREAAEEERSQSDYGMQCPKYVFRCTAILIPGDGSSWHNATGTDALNLRSVLGVLRT
jgi:hypothetical protein